MQSSLVAQVTCGLMVLVLGCELAAGLRLALTVQRLDSTVQLYFILGQKGPVVNTAKMPWVTKKRGQTQNSIPPHSEHF